MESATMAAMRMTVCQTGAMAAGGSGDAGGASARVDSMKPFSGVGNLVSSIYGTRSVRSTSLG
jgi:hypothetical protein